MYKNIGSLGFLVISLLVNLTWHSPAFARLGPGFIKGTDILIRPEFQDRFAPAHAQDLLDSGRLEGLRFEGFYGKALPPIPCPPISDRPTDPHDCPQDYRSAVIRRFFPSPAGVLKEFQGTDRDILKQITPEAIGIILGFMASHDVSKLSSESLAELTEQVLKEIKPGLFADLDKKVGDRREVDSKLAKLEEARSACETQPSELSKLTKLKDDIKRASLRVSTLSGAEAQAREKLKSNPSWKDTEALMDLILKAWVESSRPHSPYPAHIVEQTLSTYVLAKAGDREKIAILRMLKAARTVAPHLIAEGHDRLFEGDTQVGPNLNEAQTAWVGDSYSQNDYRHWQSHFHDSKPTHAQIDELKKNPERMTYFTRAFDLYDQVLPPFTGYGQSKHPSLRPSLPEETPPDAKKRAYPTYTDCGETSLRNFFKSVFFDPNTRAFNPDLYSYLSPPLPDQRLRKAKGKRKDEVRELGLLGYFRLFSAADAETVSMDDPKNPGKQRAMTADDYWSKYVVSDLPGGISYQEPKENPVCNMRGGMNNILITIRHLLGQDKNHEWDALNRSQKWDKICALLSREGFRLSWKLQGREKDSINGAADPNASVEFLIDRGIPPTGSPTHELTWKIDSGHYDLLPQATADMDWRKGVALESRPLAQTFWSRHLRNNAGKLEGMRQIFSQKDKSFHPLAEKLMKSLPDDLATQQALHGMLIEFDQPLTDTPHVVGKPNVIYTRASAENLTAKFGALAATQMGKSWTRKMFGHDLAIGEPLGNGALMEFGPAKQACLDLNSDRVKDFVKERFEAREALLDAIRKDKTSYGSDENRRMAALHQIHEQHPIAGCYLMSKEEWGIVGEDFSYKDGRYILQILPRLGFGYGSFWSSSANSLSDAFAFSGNKFDVHIQLRYRDYWVRCVCGDAADHVWQ